MNIGYEYRVFGLLRPLLLNTPSVTRALNRNEGNFGYRPVAALLQIAKPNKTQLLVSEA